MYDHSPLGQINASTLNTKKVKLIVNYNFTTLLSDRDQKLNRLINGYAVNRLRYVTDAPNRNAS